MIKNRTNYFNISLVLMLAYFLLLVSHPVFAEDSEISQANVGANFMTECTANLRQSEWVKIYPNGFGSQIKIATTNALIDSAGYNIDSSKYNKDLTENDIAIIYSRSSRNIAVLRGRNIDEEKLNIDPRKVNSYDITIKNAFNTEMSPCKGFQTFIDIVSKKSILKSKDIVPPKNVDPAIIENNTDKITDCAGELSKIDKSAIMTKASTVYGQNIVKAYENIYTKCQSTMYGARAALNLGNYLKTTDLNTAEKWYLKSYEASSNFPLIARDALYNYINLFRIDGDCKNVTKYISEYKQKFKGQSIGYDDRLNIIEKECITTIGIQSKCKKLYPVDSDRQISLILIPDGYTDINTFINEAKSLVQDGLFSDDFTRSYQNDFVIYYVDSLNKDICVPDSDNCDTQKASAISRSCPSSTYVVISPANFRSYAYFQNFAFVSTTYNDAKGTFKHELGHAVFNLADEYTEEERGDQSHPPNCFNNQQKAKDYWRNSLGLTENDFGYYQGCGYVLSNIRGTKDSLMRDSAGKLDYGIINNAYIKKFMGH